MNIGVLTSSRADFGIYLPLLKRLQNDEYFNLQIIAFGTHGSTYHGETISEIYEAEFEKIDLIQPLLVKDDPHGISTSYGLIVKKFADYWSENKFDLVFCLGDRFEMSAAVQAGIPFGVKFAHIHGGETTLGAIDNIYRHQISLASVIHFTSTQAYKEKIEKIIGDNEYVFNVGSLSLDGIEDFQFSDENEFRIKYEIPEKPYILITFHPETVKPEKNKKYALVLKSALVQLSCEYFLVITMPNADTNGKIFRKTINELKNEIPGRLRCIENFGKTNYFNAMKYADFLLGNTSSGIIEAASFGKYVINVGNRQKGRVRGSNVIDCKFNANEIVDTALKIKEAGIFTGPNIYKKSESANAIIYIVKNNYVSI